MSLAIPVAIKNERADLLLDKLSVGSLNTYPILQLLTASNVVLSEHNMSDPAFGAAVNGAATSSAIASSVGVATGQATKFKLLDRNEGLVLSGTVGTIGSGADIESSTSSTQVTLGAAVSITSLVYVEAG